MLQRMMTTTAMPRSFNPLSILSRNPFTSQLFIATAKTSAADLIVQKQVEKKEHIDWQRNLAFTAFGFGFLGCVNWAIYVHGFSRIFPGMVTFCNQSVREKLANKSGIRQLFGQIALDFVVVQPVIYWPTLYLFKEAVQQQPSQPLSQCASSDKALGAGTDGSKQAPSQSPSRSFSDIASGAYTKWRKNFWEDNLGMCAFWGPADIVIYSVPVWARLPLNHAVSFVWVAVVSFFRGDT